MSVQLLYEDGKGAAVDEYGRSEPMNNIYLSKLRQEDEIEAMQIEGSVKPETDVAMRETSIKRNYTLYTNQDKVRFFKLLFEKRLNASAVAKHLGIHVRMAQRWAKQYDSSHNSIFEKRQKTGRPRLLNEEHKKIILYCIDENPSTVFGQVMEQVRQVSKSTVHDFVRKHCNPSLKRAQFKPVDRNSEEKIKEYLDWIRK
ncbi:hypothetical protein BCV72DRAFT_316914 [Rhizopus microsporus var. microsporus]|uniref:Uncharacterized protein n=1 Tax=Rhizopus microsporus var. microsporus TaxID=86635 RepID=A0A1X0RD72_RHIZD|nr:hypothetical protein BCV72DRAFT_316914 [Rhizopus microsporus var. microsporus]